MLSKEQKIKIILDVKKGNISSKVLNHLGEGTRGSVLFSEKELLIDNIEYDRETFYQLYNYIQELKPGILCVTLAWDNCREGMLHFYDNLEKL